MSVYIGLFGRRNLAHGLISQISCAFKSQSGTGCTFDTQDRCGSRLPSQRTQVLGHIAEISNQLGFAELAGRRISGSTERDRGDDVQVVRAVISRLAASTRASR